MNKSRKRTIITPSVTELLLYPRVPSVVACLVSLL